MDYFSLFIGEATYRVYNMDGVYLGCVRLVGAYDWEVIPAEGEAFKREFFSDAASSLLYL